MRYATRSLPAMHYVRDVQLDLEPAGSGWTIDNAFRHAARAHTLVRQWSAGPQGGSSRARDASTSKQPTGLSWLSGESIRPSGSCSRPVFSANVNLTHERQTFGDLSAVGPATPGDLTAGRREQAPTLDVALAGDALSSPGLRGGACLPGKTRAITFSTTRTRRSSRPTGLRRRCRRCRDELHDRRRRARRWKLAVEEEPGGRAGG